MHITNENGRLLIDTLNGKVPHPHNLPYDKDAEITQDLRVLEYIQPAQFNVLDYPNHLRLRSRIRYLAALWPDADVKDLTHRIHGLMNNSQFDTDDVRLILQGRRINDPSHITSEVPLSIIQGIGRCLLNGMSLRSTAREMRVSYDTVEAIEKYLGIRQAREDRIVDAAVDAARDNVSTRKFAAQHGVSKSRAHRLISKGHSILKELGEV